MPTPLAPISPQVYAKFASQTSLLPGPEAPSRAGPADDPDGDGRSVGDATGLAEASVGAGLGLTGSGDGAGAVEAADDDADAAEEASSCTAPDEPAVDEHPAIAAVTSTNPTVSSFSRVPLAVLRSQTMGMRVIQMSLRRTISRQGSRKGERFQFVTWLANSPQGMWRLTRRIVSSPTYLPSLIAPPGVKGSERWRTRSLPLSAPSCS